LVTSINKNAVHQISTIKENKIKPLTLKISKKLFFLPEEERIRELELAFFLDFLNKLNIYFDK